MTDIQEYFMPNGNLKVTEDEILAVFKREQDPVLSANEVAEAVGMTPQGAYYRLENLKESGKLKRKSLGRDIAWWRPDLI